VDMIGRPGRSLGRRPTGFPASPMRRMMNLYDPMEIVITQEPSPTILISPTSTKLLFDGS